MKIVFMLFTHLCLAALTASAQFQMLDSTFSADGILTTDICPQSDFINSISIQNDQKIVAAGIANNQFSVARYHTDGNLDTAFGTGGFVSTAVGAFSGGSSVTIRPNGKIVVGGSGLGTSLDFAVVRYHSNGVIDSSFGTNGATVVAIGAALDAARAMLVQPDGKIVLAGRSANGTGNDFALARLDSSGTPDLSFGTGGHLTTAFGANPSDIYSVALQPDGKIVAAGYVNSTGPAASDFALARYNTDGSLDTTFGTGGKQVTDISGDGDIAKKVLILNDGKILVTGEVDEDTLEENFALIRYDELGNIDSTFGVNGITTTDFYGDNDNPASMVLQPDGKIIVAGFVYHPTSLINFGLARYNSDGNLDNTFGTAGLLWTELGPGNNTITDVKIQNDGKIVAGGGLNTGTPTSEFALTRYVPELVTGNTRHFPQQHVIRVYPNPSHGKFQLSVDNIPLTENASVEIYNATGELVFRQNAKDIDLSKSPRGIYVAKVIYGTNTCLAKIILE